MKNQNRPRDKKQKKHKKQKINFIYLFMILIVSIMISSLLTSCGKQEGFDASVEGTLLKYTGFGGLIINLITPQTNYLNVNDVGLNDKTKDYDSFDIDFKLFNDGVNDIKDGIISIAYNRDIYEFDPDNTVGISKDSEEGTYMSYYNNGNSNDKKEPIFKFSLKGRQPYTEVPDIIDVSIPFKIINTEVFNKEMNTLFSIIGCYKTKTVFKNNICIDPDPNDGSYGCDTNHFEFGDGQGSPLSVDSVDVLVTPFYIKEGDMKKLNKYRILLDITISNRGNGINFLSEFKGYDNTEKTKDLFEAICGNKKDVSLDINPINKLQINDIEINAEGQKYKLRCSKQNIISLDKPTVRIRCQSPNIEPTISNGLSYTTLLSFDMNYGYMIYKNVYLDLTKYI